MGEYSEHDMKIANEVSEIKIAVGEINAKLTMWTTHKDKECLECTTANDKDHSEIWKELKIHSRLIYLGLGMILLAATLGGYASNLLGGSQHKDTQVVSNK